MKDVERKDGKIYVRELSKRDAAGNSHWIVIATIRDTARIGNKSAAEATDEEIIAAI